jgi:hypothetical protein
MKGNTLMSKKKRNTGKTQKNQSRSKKMKDVSVEPSAGMDAIVEVLTSMVTNASLGADDGLIQGVQNIQSLVRTLSTKKGSLAVPGAGERIEGLMAFRRQMKNLKVAFVGGDAPAFHLLLDKLILLVERMHDKRRRTVIIQNCSESSDSEHAKGQVLAKFNMTYPSLQVLWGDKGVVIEKDTDINKRATYYVNPDDLLLFYLAAKVQLKGGNQLEELLQANEGWRKYDIPTSPLDPGAE